MKKSALDDEFIGDDLRQSCGRILDSAQSHRWRSNKFVDTRGLGAGHIYTFSITVAHRTRLGGRAFLVYGASENSIEKTSISLPASPESVPH